MKHRKDGNILDVYGNICTRSGAVLLGMMVLLTQSSVAS